MAEYSAAAVQTVNPGEAIIFTESPVPCENGLVRHRNGTGSFLLSGWVPRFHGCRGRRGNRFTNHLVNFGANIAIPTGGVAETIAIAFAIDGTPVPVSTMMVTPAAVEEFFNVSRALNAQIFAQCCQTLTIRNTSEQAILVQSANIVFGQPGLMIWF